MDQGWEWQSWECWECSHSDFQPQRFPDSRISFPTWECLTGQPQEFPILSGNGGSRLGNFLGKRELSQKFLDFSQIFLMDVENPRRNSVEDPRKFPSSLKFPRGSRLGDGSRGIGMGAGNDPGVRKRDEDLRIPASGMWVWNSSRWEGARCTWSEFPGKPFHGFW